MASILASLCCRSSIRCLLIAAVLLGLCSGAVAQSIDNLVAVQRTDGSGRVDITFSLVGATEPMTISLRVSPDNGATWDVIPAAQHLTGDIGPGITNGARAIVWDARADRPDVLWPQCRVEVIATGSAPTTTPSPSPSPSPIGPSPTASISPTPSASPTISPTPSPSPTGGADPPEITLLLPGDVPMVMVRIPAGTFVMGSPESERSRATNEGPQTTVTISRAFYMAKYEVTQAQWTAVMGTSPSNFAGRPNNPVESITWNDAISFNIALNTHLAATEQTEGLMRLPTEAEWEYAARGGTTTRFSFGDSLGAADGSEDDGLRSQYMWYSGNASNQTQPVGQKLPNAFGLFDMNGNVWELCQDWRGTYPGGSVTDPAGAASGSFRVARGGSYAFGASNSRSAYRGGFQQALGSANAGFRPVLSFPPRQITLRLPGDVPMEMVLIPAGTFVMGSPGSERSRATQEGPQTTVTISRALYMAKCEVTQAQWTAVMGNNPSNFTGRPNNPVETVSWTDCQSFISALNAYLSSTGQSSMTTRLPTEAEWEYAARAGTTTRFSFGDSLIGASGGDDCQEDGLRGQHMWFCGNADNQTQPVGQKLPNAMGLHDMHGNVAEWCQDWYANSLPGGSVTDPTGPPSGTLRMVRGGSWGDGSRGCRSASRESDIPLIQGSILGVRLVLTDR